MNINKVKIAAASISINEALDEFAANTLLQDIRDALLNALNNDLGMMQARVMSDAGDYFTYLELDLPKGTAPDDAHRALMEQYYDSGEYGPDSYILSVRGITPDGKFWEIPFKGDIPSSTKLNSWLGVKVQPGTHVSGPDEVWTSISLMRIRKG